MSDTIKINTIMMHDKLANDLQLKSSYGLDNVKLYEFITSYCMDTLSDKQQELFSMKYRYAMSDEEISNIKNIKMYKLYKIQRKILAKIKSHFIKLNSAIL